MTNPEERQDPWKEALNCYEDFADEVITVGEDWPEEFFMGLYRTNFSKRVGNIYWRLGNQNGSRLFFS